MSGPTLAYVPLFMSALWVASDKKQWRVLRESFKDLAKKPKGMGVTCERGDEDGWHVIIYVAQGKHDNEIDLIDTVAHEANHAASDILKQVGEKKRTREVEAYLTGWIAGEVWRHLKREG